MQGVPSSLIARNESWVRQQAAALVRRMPSNVEKADLIQAGLIAVAQSALGFKWDGDADSDDGRDAFVRYARLRVKGAMLDELRQMDSLGRGQRRKVKVLQIARDRWMANHDSSPTLTELSVVSGIDVDEIAQLEQAALMAQTESLCDDDETERLQRQQPATSQDEVEARVDTAILLRRLEKFFATLPPRDRQVIDSYLGVGLTPVQLAGAWNITPSRVSQIYRSVMDRVTLYFAPAERRQENQRAGDRPGYKGRAGFDTQVASCEAELASLPDGRLWGELLEDALTQPSDRFSPAFVHTRLEVKPDTRWG